MIPGPAGGTAPALDSGRARPARAANFPDMRAPVATYRIQLTPDSGFAALRDALPWIESLGVSDLYLSPIFEARPGSSHGYDVTDPTRIREALGGEEGFLALAREARERGLGILLDIVPNHMAAAWENPWWRDVLRHGEESDHAGFFDIDWVRGSGRVVLPFLGDELAAVLERGELTLGERDGEPAALYFEHAWPLAPGTEEGEPREVLERQRWTLVPWREAAAEINYRRFFTITDLVGVRVEDLAVFEATHALVRRLVQEGWVTGLRIDHVDGLADPLGYLERVRDLDPTGELYVVVEKILGRRERLPAEWPIAGTTGYDFTAMANGLFVDSAGLRTLEARSAEMTGEEPSFRALAARRRREIAREEFAPALASVADAMLAAAGEDPRWPAEAGAEELREALLETTVSLPVYRTYVRGLPVSEADRHALDVALAEVRGRAAELPAAVFDVLQSLLTLEISEAALPAVRAWQQLTGAVMAKGVEDTAFYAYPSLVSLNEVGGEPGEGAVPAAQFLAWAVERAAAWPHTMNATSTHDTKRSEDVRARLAALSWEPEAWADRVARWRSWNAGHRSEVNGEPAPSAARELELYQVLAGAWPDDPAEVPEFVERIEAYLVKAMREAKVRSRWESPDEPYEAAVVAFARGILEGAGAAAAGGPAPSAFMAELVAVAADLARTGERVALAQLALKVVTPGVPDFYQGTELPMYALVDPDNRRPVDWTRRAAGDVGGATRLRATRGLLAARRAGRLPALAEVLPADADPRAAVGALAALADRFSREIEPPSRFEESAGG